MAASTNLKQLEKSSKLPYRVRNCLLNNIIGANSINLYACVLDVLTQGYDAIGNSYAFEGQQKFDVSQKTIDYVVNGLARTKIAYNRGNKRYEEILLTYFKQTPGWRQMSIAQGYGEPTHDTKVGILGFQLPMIPDTPARGPNANVPPLCEQMLNKIHPKFVDSIENFCELIRSRAYLALPAMAFGSLQRVVGSLTGVIGAFQRVINAVYQGAIRIIQMFYSYINGIINSIQRWIMWLIEELVPLDLICQILEAVQVLLDDINFFTSLFSQSAPIFGFLNQVQNFINVASSLISNPFSTLMTFLPPEVTQIIDLINQIGTDPGGFLTDQLTNYGYSWAAEAIQGNIIAALVDKFGPQFRAIGPVSSLINRFGLGSPAPYYPPEPASMVPAFTIGSDLDTSADTNLNPFQAVYKIVNEEISDAISGVGAAFSNVGNTLQSEGQYVKKIPSQISNALGEIFN